MHDLIEKEEKKLAKILIADDAQFMRMLIGRILRENGHNIVGEARNGEEVVELYAKLRPDLVTMDVVMPKMNGLEAIRKIISFDANARIVVVTALGQEAIAFEAVKAGAKNFVVKPFKQEEGFPNRDSCLSVSSLKRHLFWLRQSAKLELALIKEMESRK
jgi:two-component system chemotaxis response regulator CheY